MGFSSVVSWPAVIIKYLKRSWKERRFPVRIEKQKVAYWEKLS